jgi:Cu/Ag efflux pump CusA
MAMVIVGGLATSTVLSLIVPPTVALRYGRFGKGGQVGVLDEA